MAKKAIFMGTTSIDASKTVGEVMKALVESGARQIATDYDLVGNVSGLRFIIPTGDGPVCFALPIRIDPLVPHLRNDRMQARRVAWRQLYRWVLAQLAMIEVGMVKAEEVYAPYAIMSNGKTLFETLTASKFKLLSAPIGETL